MKVNIKYYLLYYHRLDSYFSTAIGVIPDEYIQQVFYIENILKDIFKFIMELSI